MEVVRRGLNSIDLSYVDALHTIRSVIPYFGREWNLAHSDRTSREPGHVRRYIYVDPSTDTEPIAESSDNEPIYYDYHSPTLYFVHFMKS